MSLIKRLHPHRDFPKQGNDHLSIPVSRTGRLVRFSQAIPYAEAWTIQKQLLEKRIAEAEGDMLLLLEHLFVYTLGCTTQPAHWNCGKDVLCQSGASFQSVDR